MFWLDICRVGWSSPFILAHFKTAGTRLLAFLFGKSTVNPFFKHFIPQVIEIYQFVHQSFKPKFSYLVGGKCKLKKWKAKGTDRVHFLSKLGGGKVELAVQRGCSSSVRTEGGAEISPWLMRHKLLSSSSGAGEAGGGAGGDDQAASVSVHNPPTRDRHVQPKCEYSFNFLQNKINTLLPECAEL